ncbi:MAG: CoA transferase [Myxococcota bacterium]|nr:CoA transferase [Myxococcota bacterium]
METGLNGLRVLDFSSQIAGPYCAKLLRDGGADVISVEPPGGDPLRRQTASGADPGETDSALFRYLRAGVQSMEATPDAPHVETLLAQAALVIEARGLATDPDVCVDVNALRAAHPALVVLSITPYGCSGPWADRAATEFTLQAESGSIGIRGVMGAEPYQAGGRIAEWAAGTYGAVAALAAVLRARSTGRGEHIDLSILETANMVFTNYSESLNRLLNGSTKEAEHAFLAPTVETPSIEPTADGFVGFCTNSSKQFSDFLTLIERPDLHEDAVLAQFAGRLMRFEEWTGIMREWLTKRTTAEIIERASELRIPVAPICNGETLLEHEQLAERGVFVPGDGGRFVQPRRPYRIDDVDPPAPGAPPRRDPDAAPPRFAADEPLLPRLVDTGAALPLEGLRILDLTAWWAGPSATHILACFGAEVIHVDSTARPDGMRLVGRMFAGHFDDWWESNPHFMHANSNKQDVTLDLSKAAGRALLERLVGKCDAVVENFTPRVLGQFGLSWQRVQELNPRALLMRMPAFGLSGPWRDRPGFAATMEQLSGLAWVTGHPDDQPRIPRGPCDPIAGAHAAFALLVALARRERSGRGHLVESTMVESALNVAAESVLEWSAYGRRLERQGNRSHLAAPQGLYECAEGKTATDEWLALSVANDAQWRALREALGEPGWAMDPTLEKLEGRRQAHDAIDEELRRWTAGRNREELLEQLRARGIAASPVVNASRVLQSVPHLQARGYFERPEHPVVGPMPLPGLPFRFASVEHWLRTPAPTLGQHNQDVLGGLLGLSGEELAALQRDDIIGTRPVDV